MHEAEEGEHRAGQGESRRLCEFLLDDEYTDGAEDQSGQDRTAAENLEPVIEHADLAELVETDRRRVGSGRAERAIHQGLAPRREMGASASTIAGACVTGVVWNAWAPMSIPI